MKNASLRPPSPAPRSYFAAGHERTLPYLEVPLRLAASFPSRCKKKKKKKAKIHQDMFPQVRDLRSLNAAHLAV